MFELIFQALILGALVAGAYQLRNLGKEVHQMALDLSGLKQAEADHNAAVQAVVEHIDDLVAKLGATDPADQAAVDAITNDIKAGTAVLAAAATKGSTPTT